MWKSRHKGTEKMVLRVRAKSHKEEELRGCSAGGRDKDSLGFPPFLIFGADLVLCH